METMHAYYMTVRKHDASYQQINIYESHQYKILLVCDADYYDDKYIYMHNYTKNEIIFTKLTKSH